MSNHPSAEGAPPNAPMTTSRRRDGASAQKRSIRLPSAPPIAEGWANTSERLARESCARGACEVVDNAGEVGEYCSTEIIGHLSDDADMVEKARAARLGADAKCAEKEDEEDEEEEEEESRQAALSRAHDDLDKCIEKGRLHSSSGCERGNCRDHDC